jgi:hypothetical protein
LKIRSGFQIDSRKDPLIFDSSMAFLCPGHNNTYLSNPSLNLPLDKGYFILIVLSHAPWGLKAS